MWMLLKEHGLSAWRLHPSQWKNWWRASLLREGPELEGHLTDDCMIDDVTMEIRAHKKLTNGMTFKGLKRTSNSMRLRVKCPWGCDKYCFKACPRNLDSILWH
jgi:ssRNA-specific RNase YbeY (16S rRNA maturation enzyme)